MFLSKPLATFFWHPERQKNTKNGQAILDTCCAKGIEIIDKLTRVALFSLVWWILAEGNLQPWWFAALAVIAATFSSYYLMPGRRLVAPLALLSFVGFFLWNSLKGGIQVARLALGPQANLRPGIIELKLQVAPGTPRTIVAGSLGLMPGTLAVQLNDAKLSIHVIDIGMPVLEEVRELEKHVTRLSGKNS